MPFDFARASGADSAPRSGSILRDVFRQITGSLMSPSSSAPQDDQRLVQLAEAVNRARELLQRAGKDPNQLPADFLIRLAEHPRDTISDLSIPDRPWMWPLRLAQVAGGAHLLGRGLAELTPYPVVDPAHFRRAVELYSRSQTATPELVNALTQMLRLTDPQLQRVLHEVAVTGVPVAVQTQRTVAHPIDAAQLAETFNRLTSQLRTNQDKRQLAARLAIASGPGVGLGEGASHDVLARVLRLIGEMEEGPAFLRQLVQNKATDEQLIHVAKLLQNQMLNEPMTVQRLNRAYQHMVDHLSTEERRLFARALREHRRRGDREAARQLREARRRAIENLDTAVPIARRDFGVHPLLSEIQQLPRSPYWLQLDPQPHQIADVPWIRRPTHGAPEYVVQVTDRPYFVTAETLRQITRQTPHPGGGYRSHSPAFWSRVFRASEVEPQLQPAQPGQFWQGRLHRFLDRLRRAFRTTLEPIAPDAHIALNIPEAASRVTPQLVRGGQAVRALSPMRMRFLESMRGAGPAAVAAGAVGIPFGIDLATKFIYGGSPAARLERDLMEVARQLRDLKVQDYIRHSPAGGLQKLMQPPRS